MAEEEPKENMAVPSGETETPASSPDETQTAGDVSQPQEVSETPEKQPSERAMSRQHKLAQMVKEKDQEVQTLRKQVESVRTPPPVSDFDFLNDVKPVSQDIELTPEEYARDIALKADNIVAMRLRAYEEKQARIRKFEGGVRKIESQYPELNPDNADTYNPELSNKIAKLYQEASRANPELDVQKFVSGVMSLRKEGEQQGKSQASTAIAKQEATGAVSPSSQSTSKLSNEENLAEMLKKGEITAEEAEKLIGVAD